MAQAEKLINKIVDLYLKTAIEIPDDVFTALKKARNIESNSIAKETLDTILANINLAKKESKPLCQDTGVSIFYIKRPISLKEEDLKEIIRKATEIATKNIPLRPNTVESLSGRSLDNKPVIHFEESDKLEIHLLLKGGGSENISGIYSLPDQSLNADRDLAGVRKCILDAVFHAQGKGCPPCIIGVAVGGNLEDVASASKKQLFRKINDNNTNLELNNFEKTTLRMVNQLGIGAMGLGGKTTALGIKLVEIPRHPASFFVGISFSCWCLRRQSCD